MSGPAASPIPRWAWVGLLAILLFDVWLRAHTFGPILRDRWNVSLWPTTGAEGEPLDCDESAYAYIGRRIVRGDVMYRDLTENKPPLGYWLYALAVGLGGANELSIRVMPIPMVLATIALVWWLALRLGGPLAACLAAWIYALGSTDPFLFGNGANLEHAINLFAVASLALMVRGLMVPSRVALLAAGAALGAASLVKQVAVTHLAVYGAALVLRPPEQGQERSASSRLLDMSAMGLGFLLSWSLAIGILGLQGAGSSAYEDIVRYGGALATDTPPDPHAPPFWMRWLTGNADPGGALPWPFGRTKYLVWWGTGTWPLWAMAVPALGWLMFGPSSTPRRLVAAWTLSAWLQVALPGLFWQHYYLLPLPGLAVAVAILGADALDRVRSAFSRSRILGAMGWLLVLLAWLVALGETAIIQTREYLHIPPQELTVRDKGGNQWVALRGLGRELGRRTRGWPTPHLFVWGWQSPLFLYSGIDGVSRHFFADPLLKAFAERDHPLIRPRIRRIMEDLRRSPPELIFSGDPPFSALRAFLLEQYRPSQLSLEGKRLMVTQDGRGLWVRRDLSRQFDREPPASGGPEDAGHSVRSPSAGPSK